jgi:hypothetical protein
VSQSIEERGVGRPLGGAILVGLGAALLALGGCDDGTTASGTLVVPESELEFVTLRAGAPPLTTTDTSFWAVRGEDRELEIRFQGQGGSGGSRFLELEIDDDALLRRPDGTPFALGDSVEIFVTIEEGFFRVQFEPSGLEFNPDRPAELEIEYGEAEDEFLDRELEFDLWRQEQPGEPWERIGSVQIDDLDEVEADLLGFTRFALAIGR